MSTTDLDRIEADLVKGSVMTCEFVDRVRILVAQLRELLKTA